jgi:hypothetical protein
MRAFRRRFIRALLCLFIAFDGLPAARSEPAVYAFTLRKIRFFHAFGACFGRFSKYARNAFKPLKSRRKKLGEFMLTSCCLRGVLPLLCRLKGATAFVNDILIL